MTELTDLVWVGPRFCEAQWLPSASRTLTISCESGGDYSLEDVTLRREAWDYLSTADERLRALAVRALSTSSSAMVVPYSSCREIGPKFAILAPDLDLVHRWSDKWYCRSRLAAAGIRVPPSELVSWQQLRNIEITQPLVVQRRRGSSGNGTLAVSPPGPIKVKDGEDRVVSPRLTGLPLNSSGVVFASGDVMVWPASIQLIDLQPMSFPADFGSYYGNSWIELPERLRLSVQEAMLAIGELMGGDGYVGAFGADFIAEVPRGQVTCLEINPRFQGSTDVQSVLDVLSGRPTILEQHCRAHAGDLAQPDEMDQYSTTLSWVKVRARRSGKCRLPKLPGRARYLPGVAREDVQIETGATIARVLTASRCATLQGPTLAAMRLAGLDEEMIIGVQRMSR